MPTSGSIDPGTLPPDVVRVARRAEGVELYFPPLRTPQAAAMLGAFGGLSLTLSLLATLGLAPAGGSDAHDLLAIALLGSFIAPFFVFGVVFMALAAYMLANSLTVNITPETIGTVRRVFGLPLARRTMRCAEIAAVESQIPAKYQRLFSAEPCYRLIARDRTSRGSELVLAEGLNGEALMEQVRHLIANAAGLNCRTIQADKKTFGRA